MLSRLEIAMSNKTLVDQWVERDEDLRVPAVAASVR